MNIEFTLLLIDDEVTGLELGDFRLSHEGKIISSENRHPSQSIMIFIFLSSLLDELTILRTAKNNSWCMTTAANSSFSLYINKKDKTLLIKNAGTVMKCSFEEFSELLYTSIKSWLLIWQPRMNPDDGALCDLLQSMSRFRSVFEYET